MTTIAVATFPGDVNFDGIVNAQDIAVLAGNWLHHGLNGDANGDDIVNARDIAVIASHWLQTAGGVVAVPEPGTLVNATLIALIFLGSGIWHTGVRSRRIDPSGTPYASDTAQPTAAASRLMVPRR